MPTLTREDYFKKTHPNSPLSDMDRINYPQYLDDDYLSEIEQYKNESWYSYLLNNPWLAGNQAPFSPNFWQSLGEGFGDYSSRDKYYAELRSNRSQWLSEFLEKMRQQDYDSPLQQAQRERVAGLNPDLTGNITPGAAAENDQPFQSVDWPTDSVTQSVTQTGLSFISQIMSMAQSFQSLKSGSNALVQQEIQNNSSARDFVLNQIAGSSFFDSNNDLDHIDPADLANNILGASAKVDYSVYSPRTRKLIRRMFGAYAKDVKSGKSPMAVESLKSELRKRIAQNNSDAVKSAGSPLFDEDFNKFLRNYADILGKYEYKLQLAEYDSRLAKAGYDTQYFHSLNPELHAQASNEASKAEKVTKSQESIVEGMWNEVYKLCKESNSWYGTIGLVLIPFLRSMASSTSFGFGRYGKNGKFGVTGINF